MKRIFIIHGWGESSKKSWFPWIEKELRKKGFRAAALVMKPQPPILSKWKKIIEKSVKSPDADTYFVAHSAGCLTVLHYLSELPANAKVGGVIFVAGWTDNLGMKELDNFFAHPLDWEAAKKHCKKFVYFGSTDDPYVPLKHAQTFKKRLGAKIIILKERKHFGRENKINDLPEALGALLKMMKK